MYLFGKNSILERLKKNPESIRKIFLCKNLHNTEILDLIKYNKIQVLYVEKEHLLSIKKTERFQGVIAVADEFKYTDFEDILSKNLSIIFLDGITDPNNLGSIIRTCAGFGGFGLVIPKHRACNINETVLNIASGGENYVPISRVTNLSQSLKKAKDMGYWIAGGVVENGRNLYDTKLPFPVCLVVGSEGKGIHKGLFKEIDLRLTLPMQTSLSFNVAVACAIFCYEIKRHFESVAKPLT